MKLLKKEGIKLYSAENEEKSSVVGRWKRKMKNIMWKCFQLTTTRFIITKQQIVFFLITYHRLCGMDSLLGLEFVQKRKCFIAGVAGMFLAGFLLQWLPRTHLNILELIIFNFS